jgi:hypothetical protein
LNLAEGLRSGQDRHALVADQRQGVAIAGYDGIDSGGQGAGNDMIIVRVIRHDAGNGGWFDGVRQCALPLSQQLGCRLDLP